MKNSIVVDGVVYYREPTDLTKAKKVLEKYDWMKEEIRSELGKAQSLYDNMKEEGLTFSTIEAEGALRAVKRIVNTINYIDEYESVDSSPA